MDLMGGPRTICREHHTEKDARSLSAIVEDSEFQGRRIAVIGMERTGLAAAEVLQGLGADVVLSDRKDKDALGPSYRAAERLGVQLLPGTSPHTAIEGCSLVVPSPGVPRSAPVLQMARAAGIPILSEIEVAYRIARAPIVAVTGTNGKSTTVVWIGRMLEEAGIGTIVGGNISTGAIKLPLIEAARRADPTDVIVAEISSFQLEWVQTFRPKVGVLTNVTLDHLDRHGSFAEYAACKARLFAAQRPDDTAVINGINAPARLIGYRAPSRVLWFDRGYCFDADGACVRDGILTVRLHGVEYALVRADELRLPGTHNIENALAASAAALAMGAPPEAVREALLEFTGLDNRMEIVAEAHGVAFINGSMTTNVHAAIRTLEAVDRPIVLIAGGSPKGESFERLGCAMARYVEHAVLIGRAAREIAEAAHEAGFTRISFAGSMDEAVQEALVHARPGDAVLLAPACASHDMFRNFEERGEAFRAAVQRVSAVDISPTAALDED